MAGYETLTEKEKETLRLIGRGHDAKSLARHLGLSVHTVNERLRDARRKLEVSSSREAARLLLASEREHPHFLADEQIGAVAARALVHRDRPPTTGPARLAWIAAGAVFMSMIVGLFALSLIVQPAAPTDPTAAPSAGSGSVSAEESNTDVVRAARDWLALHDAGRWEDGWKATGASFRKLNTLERWTEVAQAVRPPLGAMLSRTLLSTESVPAPPAGIVVAKFRTRYANRSEVIETVSLASEGGVWRVVGIYLD